MKTYYQYLSYLLLALVIFSCDKGTDPVPVMECQDDALHTIENAKGSMVYLTCYDAWGVKLDESIHMDAQTIGASLDIDEAYETEGMRVQLDACFYEFDLPLLLPDPAPWGNLYKMENFTVVAE